MGAGLGVRALHKNGTEIDVEISLSRIQTESGEFIASTLRDIRQRKVAEERINRLAYFDQLTGLANRSLLMDRLTQAKTASTRSALYGALLFIDLDHFKTLNDSFGHDAGDDLLKQVANRLTECVRAGDTIARIGGDEFVAILTSLSGKIDDAADYVEVVATKILDSLSQPFILTKTNFQCSASIGATLFLGRSVNIDVLLKQADLAMYKAKDAGRGIVKFFDPAMEQAVLERAAIEHDLRDAVQNYQFKIVYQPQVTGDHQIVGAEALLRWHHPKRGDVPPSVFIPLAEESKLIVSIGKWVILSACYQLSAWAEVAYMSKLYLAVNISAQQLQQETFVESVVAALKQTRANPQLLKLELTESQFVSDHKGVMEKMSALKGLGVGFSLDDFGTGYSSLSYLYKLPLDQLKIDQSFVRHLLHDSNGAAIVRMIVALGEALGLSVIAEGVELESQQEQLALLGCSLYQGYLFSKPITPYEFQSLIEQRTLVDSAPGFKPIG